MIRLVDLDYRYLRAFAQTARLLNFSKAAQELGIAQSAVSRQIKLLEETLGEQLILRSSKKVVLSEKGTQLLQLFENFESSLAQTFLGESHKTLRVGILHGLLETWFVNVAAEYAKQKKLSLDISVEPLDFLQAKLQNNTYDIVFTTENIQTELISSLKLFDEKMVLISAEAVEFAQIPERPWIMYNDHDHLSQLYDKSSKQIMLVNSITAIVSMVKKGMGLAVVPQHILGNSAELHVKEIKNLPKQSIYLSTLNYQSYPEPLKSLVDIIKKQSPIVDKKNR